jgi:predicted O-methyltransferase YrrM
MSGTPPNLLSASETVMLKSKALFRTLKQNPLLSVLALQPFWMVRFIYHAIRERSGWFFRYYPGYHGSTIPSRKYLAMNRARLFKNTPFENDGIALNRENQRALLDDFVGFYPDFAPAAQSKDGQLYYYENDMFGYNDAFFLYAMFRTFKPRRVIEVGSGFSSALMIDVSKQLLPNTHFTFIDPYSERIQKVLSTKPEGSYELIRKEAQQIPLDTYSALEENDLLFIDTSHAMKIGSDLSTFIFSVLPVLKPGVIVHFHDIWHPWEYPEDMVMEGRNYNEIYFVRAFLQFNDAFEIVFFNSQMEHEHRDFIEQKMPGFFKCTGKSLWLRKTK